MKYTFSLTPSGIAGNPVLSVARSRRMSSQSRNRPELRLPSSSAFRVVLAICLVSTDASAMSASIRPSSTVCSFSRVRLCVLEAVELRVCCHSQAMNSQCKQSSGALVHDRPVESNGMSLFPCCRNKGTKWSGVQVFPVQGAALVHMIAMLLRL